MKNSTKTRVFTTSVATFALMLLLGATAFAQETAASGQKIASNTSDSATTISKAESQPIFVAPVIRFDSARASRPPQGGGGDSDWHFEVRPYVWVAGIYGNLRVGNQVVQTGNGSKSILEVLDFAAAAQVEAIKGRWRIMIDENYVNLGTTGTGPGGLVTFDVQPTQNILEFGGSYTAYSVENSKSTATDPLPPVFSTEILGGVRWYHLGLRIQPNAGTPAEGSRNLLGPFGGLRLKVSPADKLTLSGKFTAGGSGAGSNFAWSAEGLVDYRLNK